MAGAGALLMVAALACGLAPRAPGHAQPSLVVSGLLLAAALLATAFVAWLAGPWLSQTELSQAGLLQAELSQAELSHPALMRAGLALLALFAVFATLSGLAVAQRFKPQAAQSIQAPPLALLAAAVVLYGGPVPNGAWLIGGLLAALALALIQTQAKAAAQLPRLVRGAPGLLLIGALALIVFDAFGVLA